MPQEYYQTDSFRLGRCHDIASDKRLFAPLQRGKPGLWNRNRLGFKNIRLKKPLFFKRTIQGFVRGQSPAMHFAYLIDADIANCEIIRHCGSEMLGLISANAGRNMA